MANLAKLLKAGEHDRLVAIVNASESPTIDDIARRAEAYYEKREWAAAVDDFAAVISARSTGAKFGWFQKARTAIAKQRLGKTEAAATWRRFSDPVSLEMEGIAERVRRGDLAGADADFSAIIGRIIPDLAIASHWKTAFDLLVAAISGEDVAEVEAPPARRKVIVSGMGWSGSGAIFDYLREHEGAFAVPGESSLIEGTGGFRGFIAASRSRQGLVDQSIDFFFRNLLGFMPMKSSSCFKELLTARKGALAPDTAGQYALGVTRVVRAMAGLLRAPAGDMAQVDRRLGMLCDVMLDNLVAHTAPEGKVVLLDNCIHISNIQLLRYVSNTTALCCFRDPRTNFVALKRECPGFSSTVEEYIASTRKTRKTFGKSAQDVHIVLPNGSGTTLRVVPFEKFIVSEAFRNGISASLGLDPEARAKFVHLKPWESFRNTQLHLDYENPAEIEAIRAALPEYCVDFRAVLSGAES